jgi:hypothetical protein
VVSDLERRRPIWFGGTDRSEASLNLFFAWLVTGPRRPHPAFNARNGHNLPTRFEEETIFIDGERPERNDRGSTLHLAGQRTAEWVQRSSISASRIVGA